MGERLANQPRSDCGARGHVGCGGTQDLSAGPTADHTHCRLDRGLSVYVQHQYEDTYWRYREAWNYYEAGLEGSSHFVLPKVLQWFTANVGLHHIHHLCSQIPNYRLQRCVDEIPALQDVTRFTIVESLKTLRMTLWDEDGRLLVGFRDLGSIRGRLAAQGETPVTATKPDVVPTGWR